MGLPVRTLLLDITAPGLLAGMTLGRFGCFFGGRCAGRPTSSRWGLWSSDRRLGLRRLPTQLLEAGVAFVVAASAFSAVTARPSAAAGSVFAGAIAAYTLGRQLLFRCVTYRDTQAMAGTSRSLPPCWRSRRPASCPADGRAIRSASGDTTSIGRDSVRLHQQVSVRPLVHPRDCDRDRREADEPPSPNEADVQPAVGGHSDRSTGQRRDI